MVSGVDHRVFTFAVDGYRHEVCCACSKVTNSNSTQHGARIGSILFRLPAVTGLRVHQHYFIEGHGKNDVDGAWLKEAVTQRSITTTDELIEALAQRAASHRVTDEIDYSFIKYEPLCADATHSHFINPTGANETVPMEVDSGCGAPDRYQRVGGRSSCKRPRHDRHRLVLGPHLLKQSYHYSVADPNAAPSASPADVNILASLTSSACADTIKAKLTIDPIDDYNIEFAPPLRQSTALLSYSKQALAVLQRRAQVFRSWRNQE